MSIFNFLGGFALFNMFCDWFSGKPNRSSNSTCDIYDPGRYRDDYDRIEELEQDISEAENHLDRYKEFGDTDAYDPDDLRDELDDLREELDDLRDELDDLRDDMDDFDRDNEW